jgi:hypothetical protein
MIELEPVNNVEASERVAMAPLELDLDNKYVHDFHLNFDYCIVLPVVQKVGFGYEFTPFAKELISRLQSADVIYFAYLSVRKDSLFVLLRCNLYTLQNMAERSKLMMLLDPEVAEAMAAQGDELAGIAPFTIPHDVYVSKYEPFEAIYSRYFKHVHQDLFWRPNGLLDPFRSVIRLKLTLRVLQSPANQGNSTSRSQRLFLLIYMLWFNSIYLRRMWTRYTISS